MSEHEPRVRKDDDGAVVGIVRKSCEPSSALPACSIAVPVRELEKLERERERLYELLEPILDEQQMLRLVNVTGQIWRVANTKKWD